MLLSRAFLSELLGMSRRGDSRDEGEPGVVAFVGACNEIQITPLVSVYHRNDASARRYSAGRLVHKLM